MISFKKSRVVTRAWLLDLDNSTRHSLSEIFSCIVST